MESNWFRPPYGRMTSKQATALQNRFPEIKIAMWDVLSGDFDRSKKGVWCARQVQQNVRSGSVVVMHDSEKAWDRLRVCLPPILEYFNNHGFRLEKLPGS
jgi:peptidoglycan/xylan/chitin deacetylase (PgdA/CDA1 family)